MHSKAQRGFTLIEILVVIGIIAILATIVLIAINPARQFAQARDTQRTSNVNAILNAVGQNIADNKGLFDYADCDGADIPAVAMNMSSVAADYDIYDCIVPTYMSEIPFDPKTGSLVDGTNYNTGYKISKAATGRITVSAQAEIDQDDDDDVDANDIISITR